MNAADPAPKKLSSRIISEHIGEHVQGIVEQIAERFTKILTEGQVPTQADITDIIGEELDDQIGEVSAEDFITFFQRAIEMGASGFLAYNDVSGYSDIVAIRGMAKDAEVWCSVFDRKEPNDDYIPTEEEYMETTYGPHWREFIQR